MARKMSGWLAMALLCAFGAFTICLAADPPVKTGEKRDTMIYVRTNPPGAKVLLDGKELKELGRTNGLFRVEAGVATIILELEGYGQVKQQVRIPADKITRIVIELKPQNPAGEGETTETPSNGKNSKQPNPEAAAESKLVREAEAGNYWSKYRLWAGYQKGADDIQKNPEKAKKLLAELVKDAYLAKFRPINGFVPKTPHEFLTKFNEHSALQSEPTGLGGASFFRTKSKDGILIGSFITAYPDKMRKAIANNPSLELISIEKMTPEMFIPYDASPQESLDMGDETPSEKTGVSDANSTITTVPQIVETSPRVGADDVDPATSEIVVKFDEDMDKRGYSWTGGGPDYPPMSDGKKSIWRDARTCVLPVKLEAGHYYRVGINSASFRNFRSAAGEPVDPSAIYFVTKGATEEVKSRMRKPQIVSISPPNGAKDVDPAITELRVTFDVPMGEGFAWTGGGPSCPKVAGLARWTGDHKTCVLPVELKPNWDYRSGLNSRSFNDFQSASGVPLEQVEYRFTTRGADEKKHTAAVGAEMIAGVATVAIATEATVPEIVSMNPANGAKDVDPTIKELRVKFNVPMGDGFSWTGEGGPNFPKATGRPRWSKDHKTCVLPVKLEPGSDYELGLNSPSFKNFQSRSGVPLEPVVYQFTTRDIAKAETPPTP